MSTTVPMQIAIELARRSVELGGGPFGAVVVRDGEVVAQGRNMVVESGDPTAHAEVIAIREACRILDSHLLDGCEIYTNCEPCPMCLGAIWWARIRRMHFACTRSDAAAIGFDDETLYTEVGLPLQARSLASSQSMRSEALEVFALWSADPDRTPY